MAWPDDIDVKDAAGVTRTAMPAPNTNGRKAAANSRPTVWSNEDYAAIGAPNEAAAAGDTSNSGLNGLFKRLLQRVTAMIAALGAPSDAAYTGSGDMTLAAGIKAMAANSVSDEPVPTSDAPYTHRRTITPGTPVTAGRAVMINCTTAGTFTLTLSSGNTIALGLAVGVAFLDKMAVTDVALSGGAAGAVSVLDYA